MAIVQGRQFADRLEAAGFRLDMKNVMSFTLHAEPCDIVHININMALDDGNMVALAYVLKDMAAMPELVKEK